MVHSTAFAVWDQIRLGTAATAQAETSERQGRAHQGKEVASGKRVAFHLGRAGGEFTLQPAPELGVSFNSPTERQYLRPVGLGRSGGCWKTCFIGKNGNR